MSKPIFQIGDYVYVPRFQQTETKIVCPDCLGQKAVTLIMGDKQHVSIECAGCKSGYEPARGYRILHERVPSVEIGKVTSVALGEDGFLYSGDGFYNANEHQIAQDRDNAMKIAENMAASHKAEELKRFQTQKEFTHRTWAWHAHYYRSKVRQAQKDIETYTAMLNVAKENCKGGEPSE